MIHYYFLADNGPWDMKCQYAGIAGPYTGAWQADFNRGGGGGSGKFSVWEGGHRVPSILVWPGHVEVWNCSHPNLLPAVA